jgi:hypothetical protein
VTLTRRERDELHAAQLKVRQLKARERKEATARRPKSLKADRGRVRDLGFLAFLRRQPCTLAGYPGHVCSGRIEAAHIRFASAADGKPLTGMQTKPDDRYCVPLCSGAHTSGADAQHRSGERAWWAAHGLDALATAAALYARYQSKEPG